MSGSGGESKTYDNKEKIDEILRELALESKIRVIENTPKYKNTITNVNSFLEQDKDTKKKICVLLHLEDFNLLTKVILNY